MKRSDLAKFETSAGRRIYRVPLQVFPQVPGNAYLISGGTRPVLVDCGSGLSSSNQDLLRGIAEVAKRFGEKLSFAELGAIVITHGHIDHFGGLSFLRQRTSAPIWVHMLDRRVLSHYEARLVVASKQMRVFLGTAGIEPLPREKYMQLYLSMKGLFRSVDVQHAFEEGPLLGGEIEAFHVPGHCSGQVCLGIDDVLLTADHVLESISPHISPEAITQNTGLGHYLQSLGKIERLQGFRLGLGGHEGAMHAVSDRIAEVRRLHRRRLDRVLGFCDRPRTVADVSREIFGRVRSYHVLLALLEAGALVEYLYQRGELVAVNVEEIEAEADPMIRYARC